MSWLLTWKIGRIIVDLQDIAPLDWAVREMLSDYTIKTCIMATLATLFTATMGCHFRLLMSTMTTGTETLRRAVAPDFTRYNIAQWIFSP